MSAAEPPPPTQPTAQPKGQPAAHPTTHPLSLERLKNAFAQMLTPGGSDTASGGASDGASGGANDAMHFVGHADAAAPDEGVTLAAILEGILFIGADDARPLSAEELAGGLRDVSPAEVDDAIAGLNERYRQDAAPYHVEATPAGYRLRLDPDLDRLRDKFYGRVRESKLTAAALEVLSVVAYRQPIAAAAVDQLRGARSGSLLSNLVRRGLLRVDREATAATQQRTTLQRTTQYRTTDRFLRLFGLSDLEQLPRTAELD